MQILVKNIIGDDYCVKLVKILYNVWIV